MILKGLGRVRLRELNIVDSMTCDSRREMARKSVILLGLKSFRIILLEGALNAGRFSGGQRELRAFRQAVFPFWSTYELAGNKKSG